MNPLPDGRTPGVRTTLQTLRREQESPSHSPFRITICMRCKKLRTGRVDVTLALRTGR